MTVAVETLLALKAFYLGHAAAEKRSSVPAAIAMASAAIDQLSARKDPTSITRLAFYHLLRAEILRHGGDPVPDRRVAQQLCNQISSSMYEAFMHIEQRTMSTAKARGIHALQIQDSGIKRTETKVWNDGRKHFFVTYDLACEALGVDESSFTEREIHFLRETTIKDMLDKHGISYAP